MTEDQAIKLLTPLPRDKAEQVIAAGGIAIGYDENLNLMDPLTHAMVLSHELAEAGWWVGQAREHRPWERT